MKLNAISLRIEINIGIIQKKKKKKEAFLSEQDLN
jgi:hypothetical protein